MTHRRGFFAIALLLAAPASAFADFSYGVISYTDIADTFPGSGNLQVLAFPAINNAGQVAFSTLSTGMVQYVSITPTAPGALITVADTQQGFTGMSSLTLNNNGVAVFSATSSTGPNASHTGIFTGNGGPLTTIADSTTTRQPYYSGGVPRIADNGEVAFLGFGADQEITTKTASTFSTVVQNNHTQFEYLSDVALNNSGQVAFNTDDYTNGNNNGAYVYRYTPGVGLVTISRAASTTTVSINEAGTVAFQATGGSGNNNPTLGIFTSDGATTTHISDIHQNLPGTNILIDAYAANGEGTPINNAGLVAFQASDNNLVNYGIYVGDGTSTTQIVHVGQTLFGKTVKGFDLGRDGINDLGQVTFSVTFTDNTAAIVRTSGVPEPASLSLLALVLVPLFSRRRAS